jgi:hypothetical protein
MSARFAGSAALISLLCFGRAAAAECTKDTDCKGSRICEQGQCVASNEPSDQPVTNLDSDREATREHRNSRAIGGTRRRSTGLMVTGIVLTAAGGISALTAVSFVIAGSTCTNTSTTSSYSTSTDSTCDTFTDLTLVSGIAAIALIGIGLPLVIVGGSRVPNEQATRRLVLTPWANSNSTGLSLSGNF